MNYVDLILKYLSDELGPDEKNAFEGDLASNAELQKEFEDVSAAYELIRDQLQKRDELSFRQKLLKAMDHEPPPSAIPSKGARPLRYMLLALAATAAILLVIFTRPIDNQKIINRYYVPDKDPVLLAYLQDTRGSQEAGILFYRNGRYDEAMKSLEPVIAEDPDNRVLMLYYLLSALELNREAEVIEAVQELDLEPAQPTDQALAWYMALALVKSDRREEALQAIVMLVEVPGPYLSPAEKLRKLLLK
jgi:tetratricopeptide (TPR) repeat protein